MLNKASVLCVMGPTATGKTGLSLRLADYFGAAIVNADALLVYRGLDIGTAKPSEEERAHVPHYLLDRCEPGEDFTLAQFLAEARPIILERYKADLPSLIVGGTGLYARALAEGYVVPPVPPNLARRKIWESWSTLRLKQELLVSELEAEKWVDVCNPRRMIRALELVEAGYRLADVMGCRKPPPYKVRKVILDLEPDYHKSIIVQRVDNMIRAGWLEECRDLLEQGLKERVNRTKAIGYREAFAHLEGELTREEFKQQVIVQTCQLAKRQRTWFRKEKGATRIVRDRWQVEEQRDEQTMAELLAMMEGTATE